jgi:hypothetical protein
MCDLVITFAAADSALAVERNLIGLRSEANAAISRLALLVTDPSLKRGQAAACGSAVKGLQAMLAHLGHIENQLGVLMADAGEASLWADEVMECVG